MQYVSNLHGAWWQVDTDSSPVGVSQRQQVVAKMVPAAVTTALR